jgi:hypothetical protein
MKKMVSAIGIAVLVVASLFLLNSQASKTGPSLGLPSILNNGDFETGTFERWRTFGACEVDASTVHNGSYSAHITDDTYDNKINQTIHPEMRLSVDDGLYFEGWVFPTRVGWLGPVQYPYSWIEIVFINESSESLMGVIYTWCANSYLQGYPHVKFLELNAASWNHISRNVTADMYSSWNSSDLSNVMLYYVDIVYHYSNVDPGEFWVDDLQILCPHASIAIESISWEPTCPQPYVASNVTRVDEPVLVKANISGGYLDRVLLKFRKQNEVWFNTTMAFNETENLWVQTMLGQSENCTIEFFVEIYSTFGGYSVKSSLYTYDVKALSIGDINGDSFVGIDDIFTAASHFGEENP